MNKLYIKPTSTSIKFEMRESLLLNGSNLKVSDSERSDLDAAMSQKKENNIWNNNLWNTGD